MEPPKLELTPIDQAELEAQELERLTQYRREYWQKYKQRCRRVYGTLTPEAFAEIKLIAKANGRTVWEEIWRESEAYRQKEFLPPESIREEIEKLYSQLRQINDSLSRIGEQNKLVGRMLSPKKVADQIKDLERQIERFTSKPWKSS